MDVKHETRVAFERLLSAVELRPGGRRTKELDMVERASRGEGRLFLVVPRGVTEDEANVPLWEALGASVEISRCLTVPILVLRTRESEL